ncbi:MAG TPA: transglycosylase SLT domain-containing protein [Synergistaceae bacterium]|nr:transglycosylase SLT domain-containing protein [Synergistaceae bacterium]HPQ37891.1 transglycosylase SLT domain-containing protein [Synergistaceae bacterium]
MRERKSTPRVRTQLSRRGCRNLGLLFLGALLLWGAGRSFFASPPSRDPTLVQVPEVILPVAKLLEEELSRQGLSVRDLYLWGNRYRAWGLLRVPEMEPEEQRRVALVVRYIRKYNPGLSPSVIWREAAAFVHYCKKYGTPLDFAVAVGHVESHFDPRAQSPYGAAGVMQVMWSVHDRLMRANGISHGKALHDPDLGVAAGVLLLSRYLRATGSEEETLKRYLGTFVRAYINRVHRYRRALKGHLAPRTISEKL